VIPSNSDRPGSSSRTGVLKPLKVAVAAAIALYFISGIYIVETDELAVLQRFGHVRVTHVPPGIHYHLPYPVESATRLKVKQIKRATVGVPQDKTEALPDVAQFITGDENIVDIEILVQYIIKEPANYLFTTHDAGTLVTKAAEAALTRIAASTKIDSILTTERLALLSELKEAAQSDLDRWRCGIQMVAVSFLNIGPPEDVADSFIDVASAREDKQRYVDEAHAYASATLPSARGGAAHLLSKAEACALRRKSEASGQAQRFDEMLKEYCNSRSVTAARLYIESMERILAGCKLHILPPAEK